MMATDFDSGVVPQSRPWWNFPARDVVIAALLVAFALFLAIRQVHWHALPAEDALMMLRYAEHLAAGHGIVWNIGDHPVEGATDFLFLLVLSLLIKISHLKSVPVLRSLLLFCHLVNVGLLYLVSRKLMRAPVALAVALTIYFACGPGLIHITNGFSATFYGLIAFAAWAFAIATLIHGVSLRRSLGFAFFALLTGLTRPDGVFLAVFMTAAIFYALGSKARSLVLITIGFFAVLGGAYFAWRFHYFGYLLPNPFYKKGGGHLYPMSMRHSLRYIFEMLLAVTPIYVIGLVAPRARRTTIFALLPVVLFAVLWILLSNENNFAMRFQYVVVPLGLLSVPLIWSRISDEFEAHGFRWFAADDAAGTATNSPPFERYAVWACVLLALPLSLLWWDALYPAVPVGSGNIAIAHALAQWKDRNYTMVVTEAGVLPWLSHWRAIDAYGLNDAEIVHNPRGITEEYLDLNRPAIISYYLAPPNMETLDRIWNGDAPVDHDPWRLEMVMSHYAVKNNYELAARWGASPCAVNVYYVRRDLPEAAQMIAAIRAEPNFDPYHDGAMQQNYLGQPPATCGDPLADRGASLE